MDYLKKKGIVTPEDVWDAEQKGQQK